MLALSVGIWLVVAANDGQKAKGISTLIGDSPGFTKLLSTKPQQVSWRGDIDSSMQKRLSASLAWSTEQSAYLERIKKSLIGKAELSPEYNVEVEGAVCGWDCYQRMTMLEPLAFDVLTKNIPGDFVEAGVYRGGISVFMAAMLCAHGALGKSAGDRRQWVADSFEGMPSRAYSSRFAGYTSEGFAPGILKGNVHEVKSNFVHLTNGSSTVAVPKRCLSKPGDGGGDGAAGAAQHAYKPPSGVGFLKGWFNESLPGPIEKIALLRADSDLYASIYDTLKYLYPKLSVGGYVVFDDWKYQQAQEAILQYRAEHGISSKLYTSGRHRKAPFKTLDQMVFWQKSDKTG